jgi:hypothetical protein
MSKKEDYILRRTPKHIYKTEWTPLFAERKMYCGKIQKDFKGFETAVHLRNSEYADCKDCINNMYLE